MKQNGQGQQVKKVVVTGQQLQLWPDGHCELPVQGVGVHVETLVLQNWSTQRREKAVPPLPGTGRQGPQLGVHVQGCRERWQKRSTHQRWPPGRQGPQDSGQVHCSTDSLQLLSTQVRVPPGWQGPQLGVQSQGMLPVLQSARTTNR
jgi:hypothetical protein